MEHELLLYPKNRALQLEREVDFEKTRRKEIAKELTVEKKNVWELRQLNASMTGMSGKIADMSKVVANDLNAYTLKEIKQKKLIHKLYMELGYTNA